MTTLVLIPGIQGRSEWMMPAIRALRHRFHVLTFSLNAIGTDHFFEGCVERIDRLLADAGATQAVVTGVSFGGLVALRYAAARPATTAHLVLTSSPSPRWPLDATSARYIERPRLALPLFAVRAIPRLAPEIHASFATWSDRLGFAAAHVVRVARNPVAPRKMAAWVRAWQAADLVSDCRRVEAPTLVITGAPSLDRVVPVASSLDYLTLIPGARHVTLERTGHLGYLTRPEAYAAVVADFAGGREVLPVGPAGPGSLDR
jgi:pimeloyl-ACP methyl ester carboxylesterase